jgi:hypothetical protein
MVGASAPPGGGCWKDTLVYRGATGRKRVAVDLGRVAIALVLLYGRLNHADAAVEWVQRLLNRGWAWGLA